MLFRKVLMGRRDAAVAGCCDGRQRPGCGPDRAAMFNGTETDSSARKASITSAMRPFYH